MLPTSMDWWGTKHTQALNSRRPCVASWYSTIARSPPPAPAARCNASSGGFAPAAANCPGAVAWAADNNPQAMAPANTLPLLHVNALGRHPVEHARRSLHVVTGEVEHPTLGGEGAARDAVGLAKPPANGGRRASVPVAIAPSGKTIILPARGPPPSRLLSGCPRSPTPAAGATGCGESPSRARTHTPPVLPPRSRPPWPPKRPCATRLRNIHWPNHAGAPSRASQLTPHGRLQSCPLGGAEPGPSRAPSMCNASAGTPGGRAHAHGGPALAFPEPPRWNQCHPSRPGYVRAPNLRAAPTRLIPGAVTAAHGESVVNLDGGSIGEALTRECRVSVPAATGARTRSACPWAACASAPRKRRGTASTFMSGSTPLSRAMGHAAQSSACLIAGGSLCTQAVFTPATHDGHSQDCRDLRPDPRGHRSARL